MAFKFIVLATLLAYANAGNLLAAPAVATYSSAPAVSSSYIHQSSPVAVAHAAPVLSTYASPSVAIHAPAYGSSHQSVERSLGGAQSVSHYSKAVDSAFSSVRKYDTRYTNDALTVAHAPVVSTYSAPLVTKTVGPAVAYSSPVYTKTYAAAPVATYATHSAPVATYAAHAAPVATYATHAAPVATYAAHAAPVATYATHAAPVATYAAHAAPVATYAAHVAPVATYAAHAAPVATYAAHAAPVVAKAAVAYSPATVVSHTTFTGLGATYQW